MCLEFHLKIRFILHSNYIRVTFKLHSCYIQIIFMLHSNYIYTIFKMYWYHIQFILLLNWRHIKIFEGPPPLSIIMEPNIFLQMQKVNVSQWEWNNVIMHVFHGHICLYNYSNCKLILIIHIFDYNLNIIAILLQCLTNMNVIWMVSGISLENLIHITFKLYSRHIQIIFMLHSNYIHIIFKMYWYHIQFIFILNWRHNTVLKDYHPFQSLWNLIFFCKFKKWKFSVIPLKFLWTFKLKLLGSLVIYSRVPAPNLYFSCWGIQFFYYFPIFPPIQLWFLWNNHPKLLGTKVIFRSWGIPTFSIFPYIFTNSTLNFMNQST